MNQTQKEMHAKVSEISYKTKKEAKCGNGNRKSASHNSQVANSEKKPRQNRTRIASNSKRNEGKRKTQTKIEQNINFLFLFRARTDIGLG